MWKTPPLSHNQKGFMSVPLYLWITSERERPSGFNPRCPQPACGIGIAKNTIWVFVCVCMYVYVYGIGSWKLRLGNLVDWWPQSTLLVGLGKGNPILNFKNVAYLIYLHECHMNSLLLSVSYMTHYFKGLWRRFYYTLDFWPRLMSILSK